MFRFNDTYIIVNIRAEIYPNTKKIADWDKKYEYSGMFEAVLSQYEKSCKLG